MEQTYTYKGPISAVTLPADTAHPKGRHVQLFPGKDVTLPDDNTYVQCLVARGYLAAVATPMVAAKPVVATATPAKTSITSASAKATTEASAVITTGAEPTAKTTTAGDTAAKGA